MIVLLSQPPEVPRRQCDLYVVPTRSLCNRPLNPMKGGLQGSGKPLGTEQLIIAGLTAILMNGVSSIRPVRETVSLVLSPTMSSYYAPLAFK